MDKSLAKFKSLNKYIKKFIGQPQPIMYLYGLSTNSYSQGK